MTAGYLSWLARIEDPATADAGGVRDIDLYPAGVTLPGLTGLLHRLIERLADQPRRTRPVAVVVTAALRAAPAVYAGGAPEPLIAEIGTLVADAQQSASTVLVHTLPYAGPSHAEAVDVANDAIAAAVAEEGAQLVAVHRVATLDVLAAAENFPAVATALAALGRTHRTAYLWNTLVDLAWAHWHLLALALAATPKVIITDLDGVLWPGTLVEDGDDAALAAGGPIGQLAHSRWRAHLAHLQRRGLLVAAVSKNTAEAAAAVLGRLHPPLPTAGIWADTDIDKVTAVGQALNLFDGIAPAHAAFVDDQPAQQERLRLAYPDLAVPAAVASPLLVVDLLHQLHPGSDGPVTTSDLHRTSYYAARQSGELVPEIRCLIDPEDPDVVDRLAQLHARTNQFNMTTRRRTADDLRRLVDDPYWMVLAFEVTYHGSDLPDEIVGCAEIDFTDPNMALLDSFLASCRLLWAGAQRRMFDQILAAARDRGVEKLTACWAPNGRNEAYRDWFGHRDWGQPAPNGAGGLLFTGSTTTRDGESPDDLLAIMGRFLDSKPAGPPLPYRTRLRHADRAAEMYVPGGTVQLGLPPNDIAVVRAVFGIDPIGEAEHTADLRPYWIDRHLISREMFAAFLRTTGADTQRLSVELHDGAYVLDDAKEARPAPGTGPLPAVTTRAWAQAYAGWVGGRLPTEAEWEHAARGTDGRWFPWGRGHLPEPPRCLERGSGLHSIDHNADGQSPFGVLDMVGHVWQWTSDTYRGHPAYRGGDTRSNAYFLRATVRPLEAAEHCGHQVGFRVVRDIDDSAERQ